jgi:hypothetical protein
MTPSWHPILLNISTLKNPAVRVQSQVARDKALGTYTVELANQQQGRISQGIQLKGGLPITSPDIATA